jgi:hypothetical protein
LIINLQSGGHAASALAVKMHELQGCSVVDGACEGLAGLQVRI